VSVGVLFPGQGSQYVGMGSDLFDLRPDLLGAGADEVLGFSLRDLCLEGSEEELTRTEHAQPALFALSYALWEELVGGLSELPGGAAGHSLGEYTALTAAGFLDYDAALSVVAKRGRAMAEAAALTESGMAALIGADEATAASVAERSRSQGGTLQVANVNAPGQVVVAGSKADIEWLVANGGELGVRRVIPLKVSGAFHSSFMEPAAADLEGVFEEVTVSEPSFPVWANTTAQPHDPAEVKGLLARQVVAPVLFSRTLENMAAAGIDTFVHVGPGDVTAGLARKTVPWATVVSVSTIADIGNALEAIGTMGEP
jgi:[acyl-carrier-protein] S-malonyltransferase